MHLRSIPLSPLMVAAAVSGCVWLGGNRLPIYQVERAPLPEGFTLEQVDADILRAVRMEGWEIEPVEPQLLYLTRSRGQHSATAALTYDVHTFSIELRSSRNFKQTDRRIHKLYNEWVRSLEATIRCEVRAVL